MPKEIERKYLVTGDGYRKSGKAVLIRQGFLSTDKERVVRVRIKGSDAFLTIKGASQGITRAEFEYPIPMKDAVFLLDHLCIRPIMEKYRYKLNFEGSTWEVDEFLGENEGLVVAEIELENPDQSFPKPEWLGEEVTDDPRYYNANLVEHPYRSWRDGEGH